MNVFAWNRAPMVLLEPCDRSALTLEIVDVDDAREAADAVEEESEVVVRAVQLNIDRPLAVEVTIDEVAGLNPQDLEIALLGERPDATQQLRRVAARPAES